jgi:hypothetical protein
MPRTLGVVLFGTFVVLATGAFLVHTISQSRALDHMRWNVGLGYKFLIYDDYRYRPGFHPPGLPPSHRPPSCFLAAQPRDGLPTTCNQSLEVVDIAQSDAAGGPPPCDPLLGGPADISFLSDVANVSNTFYVAGNEHAARIASKIERLSTLERDAVLASFPRGTPYISWLNAPTETSSLACTGYGIVVVERTIAKSRSQ